MTVAGAFRPRTQHKIESSRSDVCLLFPPHWQTSLRDGPVYGAFPGPKGPGYLHAIAPR